MFIGLFLERTGTADDFIQPLFKFVGIFINDFTFIRREGFIFFRGKLLAVPDWYQGHASGCLPDDEPGFERFLFDAPKNSIHLFLDHLDDGAFLLVIITALERFRNEAAHILYELGHVIAEYFSLSCRQRHSNRFIPIGKIIDVAPIIRCIAFLCQSGYNGLDVSTLPCSWWSGNENIVAGHRHS
ncbi:hypothetical protein SDC9_100731 [bioreactor metagenome]|uniref:Uncharacterized protein n=1 Tax=bioreactor metagenome TaxID=1076179 RepID=A0A645ALD8_9ZZZZ